MVDNHVFLGVKTRTETQDKNETYFVKIGNLIYFFKNVERG